MIAVVQRVCSAEVRIDDIVEGKISQGLLILLGVAKEDDLEDSIFLSDKILHLRIFEDEEGKMNRSLMDIAGEILVVSQFTLLADCRKGRRPSFTDAAKPETAIPLYQHFVESCKKRGLRVETGRFQAHMAVSLINDGPVTLTLDSRMRSR
ncbi:D-tyrosyl-tRNA(Tyr) deacylase [Desulfobotulus alkaliphilus]|uniref:D-aminoacyl-tRNA deacylase n=1 Tax=Desulfobotulus alkaliphilus TaxID=622671 RepID=A0A562RIK3_9BACT|nr:D-aminoacyl-tRNA deacylase [Desulfobotulus alkaliphilus]TWI68878.1 D-tyrosyl-tRNA(Tyr) deacylase [Desulfobotulus alkaliphilus]